MNLNEVVDTAGDTAPTGDAFLDSLFGADPSAVYFRFLYRLVQRASPKFIVELGTWKGWSTAHLAAPDRECTVITVDIALQREFEAIRPRYPNITFIGGRTDDLGILSQVDDGRADICFVDTIHEREYVSKEVALWTRKVRRGGIMLFDDVLMNDDMKGFWDWIPFEKVLLPGLHWTGFGAALIP